MTPDEIRSEIDKSHKKIADTIGHYGASTLGISIVMQEHARILDFSSQLADIASRRLEGQTDILISLTCSLKWLTAILVVLATFDFFKFVFDLCQHH